jgi:hypothetical protein
MVELASLLLVDPIDCRDELTVAAPLAVLLALYPSTAVFSLIHGFSLSLTLVFAEDCMDDLLTEGVACREVEQLPRHLLFAASELMDECFIGRTRDEHSNHVYIHDIRKLIALLEKATDVLVQSLSRFLFAGLEIPRISWAHVRALKVPYEDALKVCP